MKRKLSKKRAVADATRRAIKLYTGQGYATFDANERVLENEQIENIPTVIGKGIAAIKNLDKKSKKDIVNMLTMLYFYSDRIKYAEAGLLTGTTIDSNDKISSISNRIYTRMLEKNFNVRKIYKKYDDETAANIIAMSEFPADENGFYLNIARDMVRNYLENVEGAHAYIEDLIFDMRKFVACCIDIEHANERVTKLYNEELEKNQYLSMYSDEFRGMVGIITGEFVDNPLKLILEISNKYQYPFELLPEAVYTLMPFNMIGNIDNYDRYITDEAYKNFFEGYKLSEWARKDNAILPEHFKTSLAYGDNMIDKSYGSTVVSCIGDKLYFMKEAIYKDFLKRGNVKVSHSRYMNTMIVSEVIKSLLTDGQYELAHHVANCADAAKENGIISEVINTIYTSPDRTEAVYRGSLISPDESMYWKADEWGKLAYRARSVVNDLLPDVFPEGIGIYDICDKFKTVTAFDDFDKAYEENLDTISEVLNADVRAVMTEVNAKFSKEEVDIIRNAIQGCYPTIPENPEEVAEEEVERDEPPVLVYTPSGLIDVTNDIRMPKCELTHQNMLYDAVTQILNDMPGDTPIAIAPIPLPDYFNEGSIETVSRMTIEKFVSLTQTDSKELIDEVNKEIEIAYRTNENDKVEIVIVPNFKENYDMTTNGMDINPEEFFAGYYGSPKDKNHLFAWISLSNALKHSSRAKVMESIIHTMILDAITIQSTSRHINIYNSHYENDVPVLRTLGSTFNRDVMPREASGVLQTAASIITYHGEFGINIFGDTFAENACANLRAFRNAYDELASSGKLPTEPVDDINKSIYLIYSAGTGIRQNGLYIFRTDTRPYVNEGYPENTVASDFVCNSVSYDCCKMMSLYDIMSRLSGTKDELRLQDAVYSIVFDSIISDPWFKHNDVIVPVDEEPVRIGVNYDGSTKWLPDADTIELSNFPTWVLNRVSEYEQGAEYAESIDSDKLPEIMHALESGASKTELKPDINSTILFGYDKLEENAVTIYLLGASSFIWDSSEDDVTAPKRFKLLEFDDLIEMVRYSDLDPKTNAHEMKNAIDKERLNIQDTVYNLIAKVIRINKSISAI